MADTRLGTIADGVTAWLNHPDRAWGLVFTAAVEWNPVERLDDLAAGLIVEVVPDHPIEADEPGENSTRGMETQQFALTIGVRQRYDTATSTGAVPRAWIEARALIGERILNELGDVELSGQPDGVTVKVESVSLDGMLVDSPTLYESRTVVTIIDIVCLEQRER
jgi:hypothetical protein